MNTNNQTDFGMPIYNLQHMLRTIFQVSGMEPEVIPDGYFNETTRQAVENFQRMKNMEPTGVVDNDTWDLIAEEYDFAVIEGGEPISVQLFTRQDFKVPAGAQRARYTVLQAMLQVMHMRFSNLPNVEITGNNDAQTNAALAMYREMFGLPQGVGMDNQLWYHFVKAYESAALPYDFEQPENNAYKPEEARQQIDLSRRSENSMPDIMPEEQLRQPLQQGPLNRTPMLDSYQSIREARENEDAQQAQTEAPMQQMQDVQQEMQQEMQARPNPQQRNNGRQTRPPLKWNF